MRVLVLLCALAANGAGAPLGGPQPGFILDSRTGSLRPVLGIPGAMQLGVPLALPFQVASAEFDPAGNFILAISNEQPSHLYLLQGLPAPVSTDFGPIADNSIVLALNSTGQAAVLSAPGQLRFLTGLGGTPVLANPLPTQALLGPIASATFDSAGQCALLGTASGAMGALESFCPDGTSQRFLLQSGMRIVALALANQGQDAILADSAGQQVLRFAGYAQSGPVTTIASAKDGLANPVGLQVNGQQAMVADAAASALFLIDLSGQTAPQSIPLNTPPARLKFLQDRTVLLLNDPAAAPFTVFDLRALQSFFIPTN